MYFVTLEGSDFEPIAWNFTFSSTTSDIMCVEIVTRNDDIPELTETFSATIQLDIDSDDTRVFVQPTTIDISIDNDDGN